MVRPFKVLKMLTRRCHAVCSRRTRRRIPLLIESWRNSSTFIENKWNWTFGGMMGSMMKFGEKWYQKWEYDELSVNHTPGKEYDGEYDRLRSPSYSRSYSVWWILKWIFGHFFEIFWPLDASWHFLESMIELDWDKSKVFREMVAFPDEFSDETKNADDLYGIGILSFWNF